MTGHLPDPIDPIEKLGADGTVFSNESATVVWPLPRYTFIRTA